MDKIKITEVLVEGAEMVVDKIDFEQRPDLKALFEESQKIQEDLKKLKEVDEEQLKMVVQL